MYIYIYIYCRCFLQLPVRGATDGGDGGEPLEMDPR